MKKLVMVNRKYFCFIKKFINCLSIKNLIFDLCFSLFFCYAIVSGFSFFFIKTNNEVSQVCYSQTHKILNPETTKYNYAKAKENCFLFKTSDITNANLSNVIFIVPKTYFVIVLQRINSLIIKVQYKNKIGYVSADSITLVSFIPSEPFLTGVTFDIISEAGTQIRSSPTAFDQSNILSVIPAKTKNISYVASIIGQAPTNGSSNIWYYAIYEPESDPTSVYEGYIYAGKTENLSTINDNPEGNTQVDEDTKISSEDDLVLAKNTKTILIVLICVPIVLVFVLFFISRLKQKNYADKSHKNNDDFDYNHSSFIASDSSQNLGKNSSFKTAKNFTNFTSKNQAKHNNFSSNLTSDFETQNSNKSSSKKIKKISDLSGKNLTKKQSPYYSKFFTVSTKNNNPVFPTYEVIDDDDLL